MGRHIDTIVVGGGATGSAAAWQLARAGDDVALFERLDAPVSADVGRAEGLGPAAVSGDRAGGLRATEGEWRSLVVERVEPERLRLAADSLRLWRELEDVVKTPVLQAGGGVLQGQPPEFDELLRVLPHLGFDARELSVAEAGERWPGARFEGRVLHSPQFGRIGAVDAVAALQEAARSHGAELHHRRRVTRIRVLGDDRALVEVAVTDAQGAPVEDPIEFECRRLVVAAGAWTGRLLGAVVVLPRLSVIENVAIRVGARPTASVDQRAGAIPVQHHFAALGDLRHGDWHGAVEVVPGVHGSVLVGFSDGSGGQLDPDAAASRGERRRQAPLLRYAREWLPGVVAPADRASERRRLHTVSRDGQLIIDRIGPVAVAAGLSGNGLTIAPAVGALLADLVAGIRAPAPFSVRPERRGATLARR